MRQLILVITTLAITTSLCAQFEPCNSNTSKSLNDVYFIDENIGIAVGDSGIIIRSTDSGNNWTIMMELDSISFTKVKFWDNLKGVAIGTEIYTTTDGGMNWKHQELQNDGFYSGLDLFANYKFIINHKESHIHGGFNNILKLQLLDNDINVLFEKSIDYNIIQMSFINDSIGFAHHFEGSEVSSILRTIDGGLNWSRLAFETGDDFTIIEDINFITDKIGFKGGWYNPHLMKTTDGGLNWQTVKIKDTRTSIFDLPNLLNFHIDIATSNIFYACGWHGELFKSNDLGSTWERLESPVKVGTSLKGIYFINDSIGWAAGDHGTIIKTRNGGQLTSTTGITKNEIEIYPNPFDGVIHVNLPINELDKVKLYNLSGQLIKSSDNNALEDLETITPGIYLLTVDLDHSIQMFKVVKI